MEKNRTTIDTKADDHGIEREDMTGAIVSRIGRNTRLQLSSSFNLKDPPKSNRDKFEHSSERWGSPTVDINWQVARKVTISFRESYSIFDSRTRTPIRTPQNTSGAIDFGSVTDLTMFSQSFSYSKTPHGEDAILYLFNKLKFFLTPKWYIDFTLGYRAVGENKLNYRKILPTSKTISVVRDLHCWVFRMDFSERLGAKEASFHIDLKANFPAYKNVFSDIREDGFYPYRDPRPDISKIFPYKKQEEEHREE